MADGFGSPTGDGDAVVSVAAGVVVRAGLRGAPWGGVVEIEHTWFDSAGKHRVRSSDTLTWVEKGEPTATYQVSWGQAAGAKEEEGDLKTPRGLYFVVSKARGEMGGRCGAYYGGHWIKVNYPGPHDAERGLDRGWIDEATAKRIRERWAARGLTPQDTRLGSGIGLHGWAEEWDDAGSRGKSFGCVVLHNRDIAALYETIPEGTAVMILP